MSRAEAGLGTRVRPGEPGPRRRGLRSVGPVSVLWPRPREWRWGEGKGALPGPHQAGPSAVGPSLWDPAQLCPGPRLRFLTPATGRVAEGSLHFPGPCSRHWLALWPVPTTPLIALLPTSGLGRASPCPLPTGARLLPWLLWHAVRAVPGGSGRRVLGPRAVPGQAPGQWGVPLSRGLPRNRL